MPTKSSILVTGIHRSGSTWVGSVIAANKNVDTIIEPLNPNRIKRFQQFTIDTWNVKLNEHSQGPIANEIKALYTEYRDISYASAMRNLFSPYETHRLLPSFKKRMRRASKPVKLFKDPTALFAVPFLEKHIGVKPVVLVRHPAAFVLSIKEKNWRFNFDELLRQPSFFEDHLASYKDEAIYYSNKGEEASIVESGALAWKIFHAQIVHYKKTYPDWYYVTHEALSLNPLAEYQKMFDYLKLSFTQEVNQFIEKSTRATNETDRLRNAVENTKKWQKMLSSSEIEKIETITAPIVSQFYNTKP